MSLPQELFRVELVNLIDLDKLLIVRLDEVIVGNDIRKYLVILVNENLGWSTKMVTDP